MIARSRPRTADIRRDRRPELQEPPPDRLVGCVNPSLGQQFLDIPKGQREPGIEPDRVADDFWREAVALKRYWSHPMMLIGDEPQSYPSYRDIVPVSLYWRLRLPRNCEILAGIRLGVICKKSEIYQLDQLCLAERVGFEPTVRLPVQRFSRPSHSTTLAPLRGGSCSLRCGPGQQGQFAEAPIMR